MEVGRIKIIYGDGRGKSTAAFGQAVQAASQGKNVTIIQFLKARDEDKINFIRRLEPEIKVFRFEKSDDFYDALSEEKQSEEVSNIRNGINFARKVLQTGSSDMLILDEILGLLDNQIISVEEIKELIEHKSEHMDLVFTGRCLPEEVRSMADEVTKVESC